MIQGVTTVFGGTGFLGGAIVRELTAANRPVRIAARHPYVPDGVGGDAGIELASVNIRDEASVTKALVGARSAVNAVSLYSESGPDTFDAVHVQGAARVARLAREAGVERLLLISGIGADVRSPSRYVRARAQGEQAVRHAFPEAVILRPSVLFGPRDAFLGMLAALTRLPVVPLFGRGETRLQPVHVADVAGAVSRLLDGAAPERQLFELGGDEVYRYRTIVAAVMRHLGRRRPLLPVPFPVWLSLATLCSVLPSPPLTRDQVLLMARDNVVGEGVGTFADLDISPRSLKASLPHCLGARR